jgi:outer membrane protein
MLRFVRQAGRSPGLLSFGVVVAMAGAPLGILGAQELPVIPLDEAVEMALRRSPAIAQGENGVLGAEQTRRTSVGSFIPSLSTSSSTSRGSSTRFDPNLNRNVTGNSESYSMGLSSNVQLFTGFRRGAELDRAGADLLAAEARLENQRYQVTLTTKTQYFQALRQSELQDVARSRLARALESFEFTRRRAEVGTGTRSDTLRAQLEVLNARQALLNAEAAERAARLGLGRQVGVDGPVAAVRPEGLEPSPLSLSEVEILRLAEEASPSVRAARAGSRAAQAGIKSSRSQYLPSLSTGGSYNWNNSEAVWDSGRTGWSASLSLSYPIFNGFSREAGLTRAYGAERVALMEEEDARLAARVQVDNALRALETAEGAISLAEQSAAVAEEDLRVIRLRYELGVATILEVVNSQIALDEQLVNLVTARYDYAVARAQLAALLGRDL